MEKFTIKPITKDGRPFYAVLENGKDTGRGSYDNHSARLICRNANNKAAKEDFARIDKKVEAFEAERKAHFTQQNSSQNVANFFNK